MMRYMITRVASQACPIIKAGLGTVLAVVVVVEGEKGEEGEMKKSESERDLVPKSRGE